MGQFLCLVLLVDDHSFSLAMSDVYVYKEQGDLLFLFFFFYVFLLVIFVLILLFSLRDIGDTGELRGVGKELVDSRS